MHCQDEVASDAESLAQELKAEFLKEEQSVDKNLHAVTSILKSLQAC
jgi:hypothetical protein